MTEMEMIALFDYVFETVQIELNIKNWYDLFDSSDFDIVEERIAKRMNISVDKLYNNVCYKDWCRDMFFDL